MKRGKETGKEGTIALTLDEIDDDIKNIAAAFKARLTKRKNKGAKELGEKHAEFESKNAVMQDWIDAFEYLREYLGAKHSIREEES